jgi:polysaccharide export outer membrane protein
MFNRFVLPLLLGLFVSGCESTGTASGGGQAAPAPATAPAEPVQYQIGPGDQLQISVWQHPDLSPSVTVLPDGEISLPLIGEVKAAGLEEKELAVVVRDKLAEFVRSPEVTVTVVNAESANFQQRIRVTGAVMRPASIPFRKGMTVLDVVVGDAGGPNEFASANASKLYRNGPSGPQVLDIRLDDILKKGRMDTNYELQPSDVITIPERIF